MSDRSTDPIERLRELEEAGLSPALAHEAVLEEQLQERRQKMARGTGLTGRKPDFSSLRAPEPAVGIHDGKPYSARDLETAEAADGVGSSRVPDKDVVFHGPQTSPTLKRWQAEEDARVAEWEAQEREVFEAARAELDAEADEEKKQMEIERVKDGIRAGTLRREPGR